MLRRIHHVCLRDRDLDEAAQRWSIQFGLTVARARPASASRLACAYEPYSLELVAVASPGADHTALRAGRAG